VLVQLQDGRDVAAAVAVVGRRPYGHQAVRGLARLAALRGEHGLVALHDQLVRAGDQVDVVDLVELGHHISAEEVASAAGRQAPALDVLGVGPHEVAHGAVVGDLLLAVNYTNLQIEYNPPVSPEQKTKEGEGNMRTWSSVLIAGERPPCTQNTLSSIMADKLR
jgi:hypothetical protein